MFLLQIFETNSKLYKVPHTHIIISRPSYNDDQCEAREKRDGKKWKKNIK